MIASTKPLDESLRDLRSLINADAAELSTRLQAQQLRDFPPSAQKNIRRFSPSEAARFIGIAEGYLRQLVSGGMGPPPAPNHRRTYSIEDIDTLRAELDSSGKREAIRTASSGRRCSPGHLCDEFQRGSGKTTTAAHLAQYLAFRGYRVLAIDLDPKPAFRRCSAISQNSTWARMKPSTGQSATARNAA